ncbi:MULTISPECIES: hypothetical protein [Chryseobacterium]|uniref:Uncharacterized protein n=1 Tax=Chryseobacterium geocarposphaerae TaxID=1416776 RepID=A0ABU1LAL3_9FLAO|nr:MULTISPECIES: hypothetical protein [Chryseobacterium]MDR6403761.1 hypothetical protein [Chryseobacterium geocarposphaerae]MDR6697315.1 hypothetical protein [Chryseobacterium ginsenosidimutans]
MKYFVAVYQKLRNIYMSQSSMENDLPMICPSLRVYENEELELLKPQSLLNDDQKKALSIIKKQNVAYELNSVPISLNFWDLNPNNALFDIYRDILEKNSLKSLEENLDKVVASQSTVLFDAKGADTKELKAYKKYQIAHDNAVNNIATHLELFDALDTDDEKNNWNDRLITLNNLKALAFSEWKVKGNKDIIEKELARINKNSDADLYLAMAQNAKNTFEAAEKTDVISNSSIHDINFIPYDFMENESGWNNMRMEKSELESLHTEAKGSNENLPAEILSIDYDESVILAVEFDYSFVHLKRNWFNKNFMLSQLFEWNEPKKISDGQTISTDFKLPAITKTMMLVKNLKIILDPSITNDTVNNPNQLIYFGPLIMKQQLFVNKTNNQKFLKAVTNVRTIKSDQLNSLTKKTAPIESIKADFAEKPAAQPTVETPKANPVVFNHKMNMNVMGGIRNLRPVMPTPHVATPVRPQPTPIKPVTPVVTGPIKIPGIFVPIRVPVQTPTAANVQFKVFDKINNDPVYKCSISIKGTNNSRIFEIETNEIGMISQMVPVGEYSIELRVDDYAVLNQNFSVVNTNPLNLEYKLQREEVKFKSFFLIGMICERMPKIPVN